MQCVNTRVQQKCGLHTLQPCSSTITNRSQGLRYPVHLEEDTRLSSRVSKSGVLQPRAILQEGALKLTGFLVLIFISILDEVLTRRAIYVHFLLKTVIITCSMCGWQRGYSVREELREVHAFSGFL